MPSPLSALSPVRPPPCLPYPLSALLSSWPALANGPAQSATHALGPCARMAPESVGTQDCLHGCLVSCTPTCACTLAHAHTQTHKCTCTYTSTCTYTCIHARADTHPHKCACAAGSAPNPANGSLISNWLSLEAMRFNAGGGASHTGTLRGGRFGGQGSMSECRSPPGGPSLGGPVFGGPGSM